MHMHMHNQSGLYEHSKYYRKLTAVEHVTFQRYFLKISALAENIFPLL